MSETIVNVRPDERKHTERLALMLTLLLGLACLTLAADLVGWRPYDSTDSAPQRSGMRPHVDAQTGCDYLSAPGGGITPRLRADGKQIGCRP